MTLEELKAEVSQALTDFRYLTSNTSSGSDARIRALHRYMKLKRTLDYAEEHGMDAALIWKLSQP